MELTPEEHVRAAAAFRRARRRAFKGIVPERTAKGLYGPVRARRSEVLVTAGQIARMDQEDHRQRMAALKAARELA